MSRPDSFPTDQAATDALATGGAAIASSSTTEAATAEAATGESATDPWGPGEAATDPPASHAAAGDGAATESFTSHWAATDGAAGHGAGAGGFDFLAAWYPLSPLEDLDPARPTPIQLLGRRFVIWKPPGQAFRVFLDACPHRLAPLSQGRLDPDSGQLMCSYHGWCFDADGLCRRIPQAASPQPDDRRARHLAATALPVQEAAGLLWLWADPASASRAAQTPLPLSPCVNAEEGFRWASMARDLPYDWQTLIENVADPAHVPFAHHGIQGDRRRAGPIPMAMRLESRQELVAEVASRSIAMHTTIRFQPPSLLEYRFSLPGRRRWALITYALPVAPGRCRIVAQFSRDWPTPWWQWRPRWWDHLFNRNEVLDGDLVLLAAQERELARRRAGAAAMARPSISASGTATASMASSSIASSASSTASIGTSAVATSATSAPGIATPAIATSAIATSAMATSSLPAAGPGAVPGSAGAPRSAARGPADWRQAYRLPTSSDRLVIAFQHWLERHGGPDWAQLLPGAPAPAAGSLASGASAAATGLTGDGWLAPEPSPRQLLDRYHQHTLQCSSCRAALAWTQRLQIAGLGLFTLPLLLNPLWPESLRWRLGLPLLALGVAGLAAALGLRFGLEPWFRYRPYDHSRR